MDNVLTITRVEPQSGSASRWLYVLHGIYGNGRNWGSLARRLIDELPGWGAILVDLRLHGGSTGFPPPHTVQACADDVRALEGSLQLPPTAILGHSFGGKVALLRLAEEPAGIEQLWVADSTLDTQEPGGIAWKVLEIVKELPDAFVSRDEVVDAMVRNGYERPVGQWLAMNLQREGDRFVWRLDWRGMEDLLRDYFSTDVWPILESPPGDAEIHVIRAARSDAIDEDSGRRLATAAERSGRLHLHEVNAGHWLNVDNPDAVLDLLSRSLR